MDSIFLFTSIILNILLGSLFYLFLTKHNNSRTDLQKYNDNLIRLITAFSSDEVMKKIEMFIENKNIIIFGCGNIGKILFEILHTKFNIINYMDSNPKITQFNNIEVITKGKKLSDEKAVIIISVLYDAAYNIKRELKQKYSCEVITLSEIIKK